MQEKLNSKFASTEKTETVDVKPVDFNLINRWRMTDVFYDQILRWIEAGSDWHPFMRKFKPTVNKNGRIYIGKLPLVREREVENLIKLLFLNSAAPTGIESLHLYIGKNVAYGVSRRDIAEVLKRDDQFNMMEKRPDRSGQRTYSRECKTNFVFSRHPHTLGIDLIDGTGFKPDYVGNARYLLVCVHKYSGYTWIRPTADKNASTCLLYTSDAADE